ncbi:MAG TPA: phosphoglucosamine mutase [Bacteroidales bacterium]|nr:phosphoglucosamine mutase [Bacteroidales bacterium]HOH83598.1 phosphoglucosamine mutase [Bacteroidales bacterium]HPB26280.1 phosphoglucosamine mutase [Bacteroidales bacterium]HPI30740.1 phosphoglucosamine mutase [Bacteroidales bacterium]HQN16734.1 phosphoglucosamine mutase [Bacteroidales bacterium]
MPLIKSISGIRGTIGGKAGEGLSPLEVIKFTSAFAAFIAESKSKCKVVVGRDARISGDMVNRLVCGTLMSMGIDVVDIGLTTTPTAEIAVIELKAQGGIIITASHNPRNWNALKLLNARGEFLTNQEAADFLKIAEKGDLTYAEVNNLGLYSVNDTLIDLHIEKILKLPLIDTEAIKKARFNITIDCVNSTGGIALPRLLKALGVAEINELYCVPDGKFPHNPEPLPENLGALAESVVKNKSHVGFVVDPDVDRLAIVCEDGEMFGEEYTLVSVADYVLSQTPGNTVSNLSSTSALRDITGKYGHKYFTSAVGEVNVVEVMKNNQAVIGGEGNGGVIFPPLHYGRDALAGIALFLSHLAKSKCSCSTLRAKYPDYFISKNKIEAGTDVDIYEILNQIKEKYKSHPVNTSDGVRIDIENGWVHLRRSNTEPIIRIYAESDSMIKAETLAKKLLDDIRELINSNSSDD